MPITRKFLDWSRPALPAVADHLVTEYGFFDQLDLSSVVVVLPGRRACRRLLELLVERTDSRLNPPQLITEGQFPELLYEPQRPFAGRLVQQLAWGEAVRRLPRHLLESVARELPDDEDTDRWMALGELLWKLHRELAADQLDFADVQTLGRRLSRFEEQGRWKALSAAQREYLAILDEEGLWDRQTARLVAIDKRECRAHGEIVLVGTVDLNRTTRAMLDQVADRVTALIHAPVTLSERFDSYGCLKPERWQDTLVNLSDDQLRVGDGPAEQADEVIRVLSSFQGEFRADDITIGMADENLVAQLQRRLDQFEVPARWVVGKSLRRTATVQLLSAVADYLETRRVESFAALVRHPAVVKWCRQQGMADGWLTELDEYRTRHLCTRLGHWLGDPARSARIRRVFDAIGSLLADLEARPRPLHEWADAVLQVVMNLFGDRDFDPETPGDRAEIAAFESLQAALLEHGEVPATLAPIVTGSQAIRLTLGLLDNEFVPPPRDDGSIELVGWLELPLDDAPALVVTSFNEPYVPSSVDSDLFLPNRMRSALGITDNNRRYARDSYALSTLLASRERLVLIAARRDGRGDPLVPSRLSLACEPARVAARISSFYQPLTVPPVLSAEDVSEQGKNRLTIPRPVPLKTPVSEMSVTSFRDYVACPYRFYLKHVLGLRPLDDTAEELSAPDFGNVLHKALAEFGAGELRDSTNADEIEVWLCDRLGEIARRAYGSQRPAAVEVQFEQMKARIRSFAQWQAEWAAQGWRIHKVEQPESNRPVPFRIDADRCMGLKGRIDRIDRNDDGRWALLDYKTGETGDHPEKTHRKHGSWIDLQLPLYRHLARQLDVDGDIRMGYIALPGNSQNVGGLFAEWTSDELDDADALARKIALEILNEQFWPPTQPAPRTLREFGVVCQEDVLGGGL